VLTGLPVTNSIFVYPALPSANINVVLLVAFAIIIAKILLSISALNSPNHLIAVMAAIKK